MVVFKSSLQSRFEAIQSCAPAAISETKEERNKNQSYVVRVAKTGKRINFYPMEQCISKYTSKRSPLFYVTRSGDTCLFHDIFSSDFVTWNAIEW